MNWQPAGKQTIYPRSLYTRRFNRLKLQTWFRHQCTTHINSWSMEQDGKENTLEKFTCQQFMGDSEGKKLEVYELLELLKKSRYALIRAWIGNWDGEKKKKEGQDCERTHQMGRIWQSKETSV